MTDGGRLAGSDGEGGHAGTGSRRRRGSDDLDGLLSRLGCGGVVAVGIGMELSRNELCKAGLVVRGLRSKRDQSETR